MDDHGTENRTILLYAVVNLKQEDCTQCIVLLKLSTDTRSIRWPVFFNIAVDYQCQMEYSLVLYMLCNVMLSNVKKNRLW